MSARCPAPATLGEAAELLAAARRVVVLTGAGISTDSGIPDFRGPQGLWTANPGSERLSTLQAYLSEPEVRRRSWSGLAASATMSARPNAAHVALVALERSGRLELLVTQNTDGLHLDAGHEPTKVVELHGSNRRTRCLACGRVVPTAQVLERVAGRDEEPRCDAVLSSGAGDAGEPVARRRCGGMLKRTTILFGEQLVAADLARARDAALRCDCLVAVGSTLSVQPAAGLVPLARRVGASVVICNGAPTAQDDAAHVVVRGPIGEVVPRLVALAGAGGGEAAS